MGFDFSEFGEGLDEGFVEWLIDEQLSETGGHYSRLWDYYTNPAEVSGGVLGDGHGRKFVQAQESGLPSRITGFSGSGGDVFARGPISDVERKEVVIENDIAWRINAMVDFLFGKGISFVSKSPDMEKRREIEQILNAVFGSNGDVEFFQNMAVLGSVYGFVDCIVRPSLEVLSHKKLGGEIGESSDATLKSSSNPLSSFESTLRAASSIGLELIEAGRALPVLDENDYRKINFYIQNYYQQKNSLDPQSGFLSRILNGRNGGPGRQSVCVTEVIGKELLQRYEDKRLVSESKNPLGRVPVVHVQNIAQPYFYEGLSDVEQLVGLQDELNTRLSDRANRITFQSFKMYLAKGVEGFENVPVSPGRMWSTDNTEASIEEFGGEGNTPGEDRHITEVREAMDKISGVTPVVAGLLKNKIGHLTSGVALKMTFMGMLAKTARKQFTYGLGIKQIGATVLELLDKCGVYSTRPEEREFDIIFPSPLPENMAEKLSEAQIKKELGVPTEQVLRELGYAE